MSPVPSFLPDLPPDPPKAPSRYQAQLSRRISLTWVGMALASVALLVIWAATWQRTTAERQLLETNALAQQRSVAIILSENLTQVVDRGRLLALSADDWFAGQTSETVTRLTNQLTTDQVFLRAALYDMALTLQFQTSPTPYVIQDGVPLQQAVTRLQAAEGRSVEAVVFAPDRGAHSWSLPLLFAVRGNKGDTDGYLLLHLDLGYLLQLYRDVELGDTGSIRLLAFDNTVLAETRAAGLSARTHIERFDGLGSDDSRDGHRVLVTSPDGEAQFHAYRQAERTPFKVVVSRNVSEVMAGHERFSQRVWTTLALLSVVLLLAASLLLRGLRRQQVLIQALSQSDQEKHALIEQLEEEKSRALALASQDHLTGLNNRRMFSQLASSHLAAARRSRKHYALLYLDLDRFKPINDSLGHHVGDMLLQEVAARLQSQVRSSDILGRLGGDEFAVLVTGVDETADVSVIATKLVTALSQPYQDLDGHELHITPSIGLALFPRDGHDLASLSRNADTAMYQSKRAGRGRYSYYDASLNPSGSRR